jgi:hypothetical protein
MKHKHHIIPKHMGGTDEASNLIELTIEEHAKAHEKLYEQHGHWQDYLAWKGLLGLISHDECVYISISEGGKKGATKTNQMWKEKWKDPIERELRLQKFKKTMIEKNHWKSGADNYAAKEYIIMHPDGFTETTKSLKTWCEKKGFNHNTLHKACISRKQPYKGYIIKRTTD